MERNVSFKHGNKKSFKKKERITFQHEVKKKKLCRDSATCERNKKPKYRKLRMLTSLTHQWTHEIYWCSINIIKKKKKTFAFEQFLSSFFFPFLLFNLLPCSHQMNTHTLTGRVREKDVWWRKKGTHFIGTKHFTLRGRDGKKREMRDGIRAFIWKFNMEGFDGSKKKKNSRCIITFFFSS